MNSLEINITPELACHEYAVDQLGAAAFGPGRFARTAFRLREGVQHEAQLSFVALRDGNVIGTVRQTNIRIGTQQALVLGPLVVDPDCHNEGVGGKLMQASIIAAKQIGHAFVILVGDEPYYKSHGFSRVPFRQIELPGPVEDCRLLYCELVEGSLSTMKGKAMAAIVTPAS